MIEFPNMIDWIDEIGMKELHVRHNDAMNKPGETAGNSFSDFVRAEYNKSENDWESEVFGLVQPMKLEDEQDDDIDLQLQLAKDVMCMIINAGLKQNDPGQIVVNNEMAPDHNSALSVVNEFWSNVFPAVQKCLKNLK